MCPLSLSLAHLRPLALSHSLAALARVDPPSSRHVYSIVGVPCLYLNASLNPRARAHTHVLRLSHVQIGKSFSPESMVQIKQKSVYGFENPHPRSFKEASWAATHILRLTTQS